MPRFAGTPVETEATRGPRFRGAAVEADVPRETTRRAPTVAGSTDPTVGMSLGEQFRAGLGRNLTETGAGAYQAGVDLLNAGFAPVRQVLGALGSNVPIAPGVQAEAERLRAEQAERNVTGEPLRRRPAGLAGEFTGAATTLLAPGIALRGTAAGNALLPQTVAGNVRQGAILGAIQPVAEGESRLQSAAVGGLTGGVGAAIPAAGGALYRGVRSALEPLTQRGQESIVGQLLRQSATVPERINVAAPSGIPGVQRTLAEEADDPGIAQLQRQFETPLANQQRANNTARVEAIRGGFRGADQESIAAIESARDEAAERALARLPQVTNEAPRANPFGSLGGVQPQQAQAIDLAPVDRLLASAAEKRSRRPAVASALNYVRDQLRTPVRNAEEAYDVRKTIDDLMNGRLGGDQASSRAARAELMEAKALLDRQMERAYPEWGTYLQGYREASTAADQARVGQRLLEGQGGVPTLDAQGNPLLTPAQLTRGRNADRLVQSATGFPRARAETTLTGEQRTLLSQLAEDADRLRSVENFGRAKGSNTVQNLATQNILSSIAGRSRLGQLATQLQPVQRVAALGERTYGLFGVPERLQQLTVEALENPARARELLARLPAPDRALVSDALTRAGGFVGQMVAAGQ